ncbi:MAG: AzlC family ABC transporter permease [Clostridia bacterium]|nr:AzlC family ABC transporter permease [Clostridia bacterium]
MSSFLRGLRLGVPIGLGYLSVSFTFGIMAVSYGLAWWQAVLISMLTLTSAGQLAGIGVMVHPGQYLEMLISQLTINVRYSFMSLSLSQKVAPSFCGIKRWLLGFFMTDEIFAVAAAEDNVNERLFLGLSVVPYFGWTLGTLFGSLIGNVLPAVVLNALCLAIYGMFLAIVAPKARTSRAVFVVVLIAALLHAAFYYLPVLSSVSSGISISISAIVAAVCGAIFFPVKNTSEETEAETA